MPEAIATTKRKFYKALDALSAPPPPPPKETPSTPSSKRSSAAAFDEARERVRKRLRQSTSSDSLGLNRSVISLPRSPLAKKPTADAQPPPNYSPWSHESFLARLKTFSSVSQWHPKPDAINEVEWAKRGWVCVDVNTVACKEEALTARYKTDIVERHTDSCLWRSGGCKDDIYRLPVVRPSIWQPELRKRCHSLEAIHDSIKDVATKQLDASSDQLLEDLPRDIFSGPEESSPPSSRAFKIAMHGWRGSTEAGNDLLCCEACFQRIGLWMYQPGYSPSRPVGTEGEDTAEASASIDLLEMHREHCPWRNPGTQKATGSLSGLNAGQILHKVASTAARDFRRRSERQSSVAEDQTQENDDVAQSAVPASRDEIARQDKERDSRLRKLKNLFSIKRRPTMKAPAQKPA
ncbi:c3hc zinc finger domain-containing [Lecanosticta acicola]|uniref:C3hc zinc finger domain-containing n=1 Tax=Lecanosticta acicola TaxID=111012 RepID=A0AAI9EFV1_9PEZI|nr:c3hc zinc finger domain-containing [Lecanosticta acicola]